MSGVDRLRKLMRWSVVFVVFALYLTTGLVASATPCNESLPSTPSHASSSAVRLPVRAVRMDQPPVIDGRLDEPAWQAALVLSEFHQTSPGDNTPPSYPTDVRLAYDKKFLYLGISATDPSGQLRATLAKRDAILNDDYVRIFLDTFNDQRRAYLIAFNPLGVQQDGIYTEGRDPDYSIDLVMESKGVVTADGYTIEAAIPFSSLRYGADLKQGWGIQIQRRIKHLNDEEDSWQPLIRGQVGFLAQAGHLVGLEGISAERYLELTPSLTISETGRRVRAFAPPAVGTAPDRLVNSPIAVDPGLTAKLGLSSNLTLDVAVNPDFAQVESDQLVVTANQRFPLFFAEKRPFFLEGIDIFQTPIRAVHTRTIIDPDLAVKLTGKRGRNTFGFLAASDNAPGSFTEEEKADPNTGPAIARFVNKNALIAVMRVKRDVGTESSVGLLATSYNFIEDHNQVIGFDGRIKFDRNTVGTFQFLGTTSRRFFFDPEKDAELYRTGNGLGYVGQIQRTGRHLNLTLSGVGYTRDFRTNVGFISETNINQWYVTALYNSEPQPGHTLISWTVNQTSLARFDWQGRMKYAYENPQLRLNFARQTYLSFSAYADYYRLLEEEFGPRRTATHPGAFFGAPERSTVYPGFTIEGGTTPSKKYSLTLSVDRSWRTFDFDFGAGPRFPRVSPAALNDPRAPLDPGLGNSLDISGAVNWQPTDALQLSLNYTKSRLVRSDTRRVAYDQDLYSWRGTYQFGRFVFVRARFDYDKLSAKIGSQLLAGWTPHPGTAFYIGYDEDLNRNGYNPFTGQFEAGIHRNGRTFFVKTSYLFRHRL